MVPVLFAALPSAKVGTNYTHEDRPVQSVRKIVVKGSVDVFFRRFNTPQLVVAGETQEAIDAIKTRIKGDKLIIENEGSTFSGNCVSFGDISVGHVGGRVHVNINGQNIHIGGNVNCGNFGRAVVGVALPEIPAVNLKGSGDITLLDLHQEGIELEIAGSGDITAFGQVESLTVAVAGSGDVDCSNLTANRASLSIAGSGDIEAFVRQSVTAQVVGSGDILVRGNPAQRTKQVVGSGGVKFK